MSKYRASMKTIPRLIKRVTGINLWWHLCWGWHPGPLASSQPEAQTLSSKRSRLKSLCFWKRPVSPKLKYFLPDVDLVVNLSLTQRDVFFVSAARDPVFLKLTMIIIFKLAYAVLVSGVQHGDLYDIYITYRVIFLISLVPMWHPT